MDEQKSSSASFENRIRFLLKREKMSQKELAECIGVSEPALSRYITGQRATPLEVVTEMATALRTSSDYILGRSLDATGEESFDEFQCLVARNISRFSNEQKSKIIQSVLESMTRTP